MDERADLQHHRVALSQKLTDLVVALFWRQGLALLLGALLIFTLLPFASPFAMHLGDDDALPAFLNAAAPRVRDAYQFAITNPHELEQIPCYCGCGKIGHTSNLSCYIRSAPAGDAIVYDEHANGCGICVDITQDVMHLAQTGQSMWEIRAYVDAQYSSFGPSTDTPLPPKP